MKKWVLVAVCLATVGAFGDELEDFVNKDRAAKKIPGMLVAIIKDGKVDRVVTSGVANLDLEVPVKRETVFEIGSMTKAFTAELIMMLEEAGKLSVDDKISKHIESSPETWKERLLDYEATSINGPTMRTSRKHATCSRFRCDPLNGRRKLSRRPLHSCALNNRDLQPTRNGGVTGSGARAINWRTNSFKTAIS